MNLRILKKKKKSDKQIKRQTEKKIVCRTNDYR